MSRISTFTEARQHREEGFGNCRPFSWKGQGRAPEQRVQEPEKLEEFEPPKIKWREIFPLEIKRWWRELPEILRLAIIILVGANIVLPILSKFF